MWVVAGDPDDSRRSTAWAPMPTRSTRPAGRPARRAATRLHGFLRDQHIIAGLGRRLANEVCHRAHLSPFANTSQARRTRTGRVVEAIGACVDEGLAYERGRDDMSSSAERPGRRPPPRGRALPGVRRHGPSVEYRRYTVAYCPTCQTDGKILADNTTSKFLK